MRRAFSVEALCPCADRWLYARQPQHRRQREPALAITPLMPVYPRSPVRPVRGEGVYLYGEEGERYLDFAAGIAVNILGHGPPPPAKGDPGAGGNHNAGPNPFGLPQGGGVGQGANDLT